MYFMAEFPVSAFNARLFPDNDIYLNYENVK